MFANTQSGGTDLATPDVCLTPPVPVPVAYPNFADGSMAANPVFHVLYASAPAHNLSTIVPSTTGDNSGVVGGVSSGTVMNKSIHTTAAFSVLTGGMPTTKL